MNRDKANLYLAVILCTMRDMCGAVAEGHIFAALQVADAEFTLQDFLSLKGILLLGNLAVEMPGHTLLLTQVGTKLAKEIEEKRIQESAH